MVLYPVEYMIMRTIRDGRYTYGAAIAAKLGNSNGAIATSLQRLEDKGLLISVLEEHPRKTPGGRRRRIFRITPKGFDEMQRTRHHYELLSAP